MAPKDTWFSEWSVMYWNSFIMYAPIIGMFLARMGKGRTIRTFYVSTGISTIRFLYHLDWNLWWTDNLFTDIWNFRRMECSSDIWYAGDGIPDPWESAGQQDHHGLIPVYDHFKFFVHLQTQWHP